MAVAAAGAWALAAGAADETFPRPDWKDRPNPLASPHAVAGGEFVTFAHQYPKSLNYYLDSTVSSRDVFDLLYESLLSSDPLTFEFEPGLARQWTVSDDKRTFTFALDPAARWSDGRPVTAADVIWTWDAVMSTNHLVSGGFRVVLERFDRPEEADGNAVRFRCREVHWRNLLAAGFFPILPRHVYEGADFNKINFEFPVVSGPYRLAEVKEGVHALLDRRPDWWAGGLARNRHVYNFARLRFRYFADQDNAFEAFNKGEIDLYAVYKAHLWATQTSGPRYQNHWIVKQQVYNYDPVGFQGFAMNLRRPLFQDVRVRRALAHLLDRRRMNDTLMHNAYFLHRSYFEDLYPPDRPCENPLFEFDKERARALLAEAGWTANPETRLLEKDGQRFTVRFLDRDTSSEKFLVIFKEDLKDAGIELEIVRKDWAAWVKDMDAFNFDMTWAAYGAAVQKDPESMWHSREADRPQGDNICGYRNAEVDALIDRQRTIFDMGERHEIVRQIDRRLAEDVPFILLWNINYKRLLYWNKFGVPPTVLGKYSDERGSVAYWWYDEDAAADLAFAQQNGQALPARPEKVEFDRAFAAP
jgi:microcin C transport system substrate-binding protein